MDFHLDWLTGCLWLAKGAQPTYSMLETGKVNEKNDDIDLLIAFDDAEVTRLLMIEAKSVTGWHNAQLRAKAKWSSEDRSVRRGWEEERRRHVLEGCLARDLEVDWSLEP
jgi:hypothetical protein